MASPLLALSTCGNIDGWPAYKVADASLCYNWRSASDFKQCTWLSLEISGVQDCIFSSLPFNNLPQSAPWPQITAGANAALPDLEEANFFLAFDHMTHGNMFHVSFDHLYRVYRILEQDIKVDSALFTSTSWLWAQELIGAALEDKLKVTYLQPMVIHKLKSLTFLANSFAFTPDYSTVSAPWNFHRLKDYDKRFVQFLRTAATKVVNKNERSATFPTQSLNSHIFISRLPRSQRPIANHDLIESAFARRGFSIVYFERLTPAEQLLVTSKCTHIAAVHGASLCNLINAASGTHVLELFTSTNNNCYEKLSGALCLNYTRMFATEEASGWTFDYDQLSRTIDSFLSGTKSNL
jgi:capsular polysaccharide biosynthesis protein